MWYPQSGLGAHQGADEGMLVRLGLELPCRLIETEQMSHQGILARRRLWHFPVRVKGHMGPGRLMEFHCQHDRHLLPNECFAQCARIHGFSYCLHIPPVKIQKGLVIEILRERYTPPVSHLSHSLALITRSRLSKTRLRSTPQR